MKKIKVILVDDTEDVREMIKQGLIMLGDCEVLDFSNGNDALEKFQKNQPDIIITDLEMPKVNGIQVIRKIKAINPNLPAILISGVNEDSLKNAAEIAGADNFFQKPFKVSFLVETVKKMVK